MASYFSSQVFSYQPGKNLNADMDMNIHSWQVFLSKHSHTCINTHSRSDVSTAVLIIQPYIYAGLLLPSTSSHTWSAASLYVESIWSLLRWCLRFLIFHFFYFISFILFLQGKFMFSSWFFIPSLCSCTCRILSCQTFKEAVLVFFSATQLSTVWSIFPFDSCQSLKAPELKRKLWNDSLLVNSKF